MRSASIPATTADIDAVGKFDDSPGADVLYWDYKSLVILPGVTGPRAAWSRHDIK
jgi:hypothetical protein